MAICITSTRKRNRNVPTGQDDTAYTSANSPRGVMKCVATTKDDPTEQPHWGRVGKQSCEDTGPLTARRMETIDDETTALPSTI